MSDKDYSEHITGVSEEINSLVESEPCQPILFFGSGFSRRYFDGPSWTELLEEMANQCPTVDYDIDYYLQRGDSHQQIGSILADKYHEWAWGEGQSEFPDQYFDSDQYNKDIFLKYSISEHFRDITPNSIEEVDPIHHEELNLLQEIQPHAVITTNYDTFLESIFPEYEAVIGQEILKSSHQSIGEIFKIHGSVTEPKDLVLTQGDYKEFNEKEKYLAAKLLTYFAEHPVLIGGYSVNDENIQRILADIAEIVAPNGGIIDNIYFLKWEDDVSSISSFDRERRFPTAEGGSVRLNQIIANGFDWVFRSFSTGGDIEGVNLKLLRSVMANTYDVVATKAPREEININYQSLKLAAESEEAVGTLFGVSPLDNPPDANLFYRYRLTDVANELDYETWHPANQLIERVEDETGVNIKESDNRYHIDIAYHREEPQHRYSDAAVELLRKVNEGEEYELDMSEISISSPDPDSVTSASD